jgi:hypothetical protein
MEEEARDRPLSECLEEGGCQGFRIQVEDDSGGGGA